MLGIVSAPIEQKLHNGDFAKPKMMEEFKEKVVENAELVKKFTEEKKARAAQKKAEHK